MMWSCVLQYMLAKNKNKRKRKGLTKKMNIQRYVLQLIPAAPLGLKLFPSTLPDYSIMIKGKFFR